MLGTDELTLLDQTLTYVQGITPNYRRAAWMKAFQELIGLRYKAMTGHEIELMGEGGLAHCTVCNGAEGSLPTMCPRRKMTETEETAVYAGELDFANHQWVRRCDVKHRPGCDKPGSKWCNCGPIPFGY